MFVFSTKWLRKILDEGLANLGSGDGEMGLFTNNETPTEASVIGDFDEPTSGWYDRTALSNWPASAMVGGKASTTNDPQTFTHDGTGGSVSIYGYFIADADGDLVGAELDPDAPIALAVNGAAYVVTPTLTNDNA